MSTWDTSWKADPIDRPEMVPLGEWWHYHLHAVAHCRCGRVSVVHTAELLKRLNHNQGVTAGHLAQFGEHLKCIRCGERGPKLTLEVRKD